MICIVAGINRPVQLRLLTMMRSSDVANIMSGILTFQDIFLIRTTDKGGLERYFNVGGIGLHSLCKYMVQHVQSPTPHLLRYLDRPNQCLGSERIAKRFLGILTQHGVDTTVFKAYSLRGAVATFLLQSGVPKDWVQWRGGWRDVPTMNEYYNRSI